MFPYKGRLVKKGRASGIQGEGSFDWSMAKERPQESWNFKVSSTGLHESSYNIRSFIIVP